MPGSLHFCYYLLMFAKLLVACFLVAMAPLPVHASGDDVSAVGYLPGDGVEVVKISLVR